MYESKIWLEKKYVFIMVGIYHFSIVLQDLSMFWAPIPNNGAALEKDLIVLNLGYKSDKGWYDDFDCIFFYQIILIGWTISSNYYVVGLIKFCR